MFTGADGSYSFTGLAAGNYTITETQPDGFNDGLDFLGTVNGEQRGNDNGEDAFTEIVLASGENGIDYIFSKVQIAGG